MLGFQMSGQKNLTSVRFSYKLTLYSNHKVVNIFI